MEVSTAPPLPPGPRAALTIAALTARATPKAHFVTWSNEKFEENRDALARALHASELFHTVSAYSPQRLRQLPRFDEIVEPYVQRYTRGWGYWAAKPFVVLHTLQKVLADGDVLLYADAGCEYIPALKERLHALLAEVADPARPDVLAYETTHEEACWTKADTLAHLGVLEDASVTHSKQIMATMFLLRKTPATLELARRWLDAFIVDERLVTDAPSVLPNAPCFVQHRHDQSVFSVLCKLHRGRVSLRPNDTDTWDVRGCAAPIQARRLRGHGVQWHKVVLSAQLAAPALQTILVALIAALVVQRGWMWFRE